MEIKCFVEGWYFFVFFLKGLDSWILVGEGLERVGLRFKIVKVK